MLDLLFQASEADAEFGVSRGVDFQDVTAVVNMDLPTSLAVYKHRVGRTARGGQGGTAISMVSPEGGDVVLLEEMAGEYTDSLNEFNVDMGKLVSESCMQGGRKQGRDLQRGDGQAVEGQAGEGQE